MTLHNYKKRGFTLLVSIIVTSMLLIISFVVVNVAYKQLLLANFNQESQYAFYNADSGIECAVYWDFKGGVSAFNAPVSPTINCGGQLAATSVSGATTTFSVNLTRGYVVIDVGKHPNGLTIINSKGYNTSTSGSARKLERGETLTYTN